MREVMAQLVDVISAGRPAAYCRLVETRGSTPQKAGAVMLVFPNGEQAGTLGGGCVEAEVKRRALAVLQQGQSQIAKFQLDHDYGWDDGLICGGRMQVLIEPLQEPTAAKYFHALGSLMEVGAGVTEAIVFDPEASGLSAPSSALFDHEGRLVASHPELADVVAKRISESLQPLAKRPRPYAARGVAYLPLPCRCQLVIVGGGHVGQAVAAMAADLDFDVWVVDDRADIVSEARFPTAKRRIAGAVERVLPELEITSDTYCLVVTRGHNHDEEALFHVVDRGARYVGLIGSRRKIRMIFDDLLSQGVSETALARVHAPVGIDIGSQTVPEIAISICAVRSFRTVIAKGLCLADRNRFKSRSKSRSGLTATRSHHHRITITVSPSPYQSGIGRMGVIHSYAIVPAAGRSRRMGRQKLLLSDGRATILDGVLTAWSRSAVTRTVVVVRPDDPELARHCRRHDVTLVIPNEPPPEMKDSVLAALDHIRQHWRPSDDDVWLMAPADLPDLSPEVIDALLHRQVEERADAWVPRHEGRSGHPALFSWAVADRVGQLTADEGINRLLERLSVRHLEAGAACLAKDIDTPEDYRRRRGEQNRAPR